MSGGPGIGKTRTATELASYAQAQNAHVIWGWCYEGEGAPLWLQPGSEISQVFCDPL